VLSGAYRDAHTIFINGQAVDGAIPTMTAADDISRGRHSKLKGRMTWSRSAALLR
jgi:hypothetical protein